MAKLFGAQRMVLQAIQDLPADTAGYVLDVQIFQVTSINLKDVRDWMDTLEGEGFVELARTDSGYRAMITAKGRLALVPTPYKPSGPLIPSEYMKGAITRRRVLLATVALVLAITSMACFFLVRLPIADDEVQLRAACLTRLARQKNSPTHFLWITMRRRFSDVGLVGYKHKDFGSANLKAARKIGNVQTSEDTKYSDDPKTGFRVGYEGSGRLSGEVEITLYDRKGSIIWNGGKEMKNLDDSDAYKSEENIDKYPENLMFTSH